LLDTKLQYQSPMKPYVFMVLLWLGLIQFILMFTHDV